MEDKLYYSWDFVEFETLKLAEAIRSKDWNVAYIAAVSRGGLVPGVMMSHHLGLPLVPVQWSTRDHSEQTHYASISEDLWDGYNALLVDDINDSGRTFIELIEDWNYNSATEGKLYTASVFQRHSTKQPSDIYGKLITTDSWIVFPWEKK